ncbi:MAG: hypothetical protein NZL87_08475, partial [Thermomicrobium sp.]|nr:hypothetical protein [Thermomicrobium sp.]
MIPLLDPIQPTDEPPSSRAIRLVLEKAFKRDQPPLLERVDLTVKIGASSHTVTCQSAGDPWVWPCAPALDVQLGDVVLIDEHYEGWIPDPSTTHLKITDEYLKRSCSEEKTGFVCHHTVVNVANTKLENFKFTVVIEKRWDGNAPPAYVEDLVTVATEWQAATCTWKDPQLIRQDGLPCQVDAAGFQVIKISEANVPPGWTTDRSGPVIVTPADLIDQGLCSTQDDYHFVCTFTLTNTWAADSPTVNCGSGTYPFPQSGVAYCLEWRKVWVDENDRLTQPPQDTDVTLSISLDGQSLGSMTCTTTGCAELATWLEFPEAPADDPASWPGETWSFTIDESGLPDGWMLHPIYGDGATLQELLNPPGSVGPQCSVGASRHDIDGRVVHCVLTIANRFSGETEPGGEQPGGDQPGGDQPGGDQPGGEQPGGEQPGGDQPGGDQPGGDQPGGD